MYTKLFSFIITILALLTLSGAALAQENTIPQAIAGEIIKCPMPLPPTEIEGKTIICGTITVPEDWDNPKSTPITITYARQLSTSKAPFADPVFFFAGGPGGSVLASMGDEHFDFSFFRTTRDVILFDQRGNRFSADLRCPAEIETPDPAAAQKVREAQGQKTFTADSDPAEVLEFKLKSPDMLAMANCAKYFRTQGHDLTQYNTLNTVKDSLALMDHLGYPEYNLFGISYGTTVVMSIMDLYENSALPNLPAIRSALIDGIYPLSEPFDGQEFNVAVAALDIFAACETDAACGAAYPDIRQRTIDLLAQVEAAPLTLENGQELTLADLSFVFSTVVSQKRNDVIPFLPRLVAELENKQADTYTAVSGILAGSVTLVAPEPVETPFDTVASESAALSTELRSLADRVEGLGVTSAELTGALTKSDTLPDLYQNLLTDYLARTGPGERQGFAAGLNPYVSAPQERTRQGLVNLSNSVTSPAVAAELGSIVNAMSEVEVALVFDALTDADFMQPLSPIDQYTNITVKCNDRIAYTDLADYQKRLQAFEAPQLIPQSEIFSTAANITFCQALGLGAPQGSPKPPEVVSNIRTLAFNSTLDTQTPVAGGERAISKLTNVETVLFPGSGHGAVRYTDCARDIANAFVMYPEAKFDRSCVEKLRPVFVLPDEKLPEIPAEK